jgi:hypothetical protein
LRFGSLKSAVTVLKAKAITVYLYSHLLLHGLIKGFLGLFVYTNKAEA